jgi:CTP:molybdopterin cytidylyltransferase MocA
MQLEGDVGAREFIDANAGAVREVLVDEGRPPDIDTPGDLLGLE